MDSFILHPFYTVQMSSLKFSPCLMRCCITLLVIYFYQTPQACGITVLLNILAASQHGELPTLSSTPPSTSPPRIVWVVAAAVAGQSRRIKSKHTCGDWLGLFFFLDLGAKIIVLLEKFRYWLSISWCCTKIWPLRFCIKERNMNYNDMLHVISYFHKHYFDRSYQNRWPCTF